MQTKGEQSEERFSGTMPRLENSTEHCILLVRRQCGLMRGSIGRREEVVFETVSFSLKWADDRRGTCRFSSLCWITAVEKHQSEMAFVAIRVALSQE